VAEGRIGAVAVIEDEYAQIVTGARLIDQIDWRTLTEALGALRRRSIARGAWLAVAAVLKATVTRAAPPTPRLSERAKRGGA
jgi:hypothetical protein